ncbi:hypothetical protein GGX14DRAFT_521572 [Mycena pura]|uniref:Stealth protein CR3 conserved region 3 domain-containing protein n=1 Tax=Mycena pura TaxID=153505 RepID=A0AAD6VG62_9AGAR|nr:hypothetical protein GGX14DRAFT_521572 [Mycena pura]
MRNVVRNLLHIRLTRILLTAAISLATLTFLSRHHPDLLALTPYCVDIAPASTPLTLDVATTSLEPPRPRPVLVNNTHYDAFTAPSPAQVLADPRVRPIRAHAAIPLACLDHWVATGRWEAPCLHGMAREAQIDLVYVWVNGSDPLHAESRSALRAATGYASAEARFREHDELRYSLRAARRATRGWVDSTWHVVSADVADPRASADVSAEAGTGVDVGRQRLGLVPQWLDIECAANRSAALSENTQLFRLTGDPGVELQADDAAAWLDKVVPSFNSHAIESQLANLDPDLVADNIIAMNDDQFLMLPTPPSAFHTTLFGPVFRMDPRLLVGGDDTGAGDGGGEWRSIPWSAHLLDERFGTRRRPYTKHNARALSLPLLHEASRAFGGAFAATPLSRFRGAHFAPREWEVNTVFLATHFVIERHREALLWSWVVGKWGARARAGGVLGGGAKAAMWAELGGADGAAELRLGKTTRRTMGELENNLRRAESRPPLVADSRAETTTTYTWVSMDGYSPTWRSLAPTVRIAREGCLGDDGERAWDMFRRLVMEDLDCGDRVISALIRTSGSGLGIFLPERTDSPPPSQSPSPELVADPLILPLVLPADPPPLPANPRAFAVRLIQRYAYAIGASPMSFIGPTSARGAASQLQRVARSRGVALMCINDDLGDDEAEVRAADAVIRAWFEERWPEKLECER